MSFDRRSFKVGIIAGVFLAVGVLVGVVFSSRLEWPPSAASSSADATAVAAPAPSGPTPPNFVQVAKAVMPAVVNISTTRVIRSQGGEMPSPFHDDPWLHQFFGDQFPHQFRIPRERRESSLGSGVIVSPDGYIITNNHVIAKADEIKVLLNDRREFTGKVVGTDPKTDIAVVKINAKNLPTVKLGNSSKVQVGQWVLAIGSPYGFENTVTAGIVSATSRALPDGTYTPFIQTDAPINPGNSGGPLFDMQGQVIGINSQIYSQTGGFQGLSFAIPINLASQRRFPYLMLSRNLAPELYHLRS